MKTDTVIQFARDPAVFRHALLIDAGGSVRNFVPEPSWQRADFEALDPAWMYLAGRSTEPPQYNRAYLERPRGHSKTTDLAVMATWALAFASKPLFMTVSAMDLEQAMLLRTAMVKLLQHNKWLGSVLKIRADSVINTRNKSELRFLSGDPSSSWGTTPDCIIADELSSWNDSPGPKEVWSALASAAAKKPSCLLLVASNAGHGKPHRWQWRVRENCRTDPAWYFSSLPGACASWITPESLAEQRRLLSPDAYRRLWQNEWTGGDEMALSDGDIEACCTLPGPSEPSPDCVYAAGLDLSTKQNLSALVVVGKRADGQCHVALVKTWNPKTVANHLEAVKAALQEAQRIYRLAVVGIDPHEGHLLMQQLRGVRFEPIDSKVRSTATGLASVLMDHFTHRTIDIYPHEQLLKDLRNTSLEQKKYGQRLGSRPDADGSHMDTSYALSMALLVVKDLACRRQTFKIDSNTLAERSARVARRLQERSFASGGGTITTQAFRL